VSECFNPNKLKPWPLKPFGTLTWFPNTKKKLLILPHHVGVLREYFFAFGSAPKIGRECFYFEGSALLKNALRRECLGSTFSRALFERSLW
jgi:hypothetical protein